MPLAALKTRLKGGGLAAVLALEAFVIFLGISASFWMEEWRERRQDQETFDRLLGEIYHNLVNDRTMVRSLAAVNNSALGFASDLALRDEPPVTDAEAYRRLARVFGAEDWVPTTGGYERLVNAQLALPVQEIQLTLDTVYSAIGESDRAAYNRLQDRLRELADAHWYAAGIVPCEGLLGNVTATYDDLQRSGVLAQVEPARRSVRGAQGECLTTGRNHAIARETLETGVLQPALREIIRLRLEMAATLASINRWTFMGLEYLETARPDIGLPVETVSMAGDALVPGTGFDSGWSEAEAVPMRRAGPHAWTLTADFDGGHVKFLANGSWQINWGAPRPWDLDAGFGVIQEVEPAADAFPAARGEYFGLNIPVPAGRYRVSFDAKTFEYRFEAVPGG